MNANVSERNPTAAAINWRYADGFPAITPDVEHDTAFFCPSPFQAGGLGVFSTGGTTVFVAAGTGGPASCSPGGGATAGMTGLESLESHTPS